MKRLLLVAVIWGAALLPVAAHGQRSMGGRTAAPPVRPGLGARPAQALRFAPAPQAVPANRGFITPGFRSRVIFPHQRIVFRPRHFGRRPLFSSNVCFNGGFGGPFFCGNGFFSSGYVAAPYAFSASSPYPAEYAYTPPPQPVVVDDSDTRDLSLQVQRLSDELEMMRDEERRRDQERNPAAQQSKPATQENLPNTVMVLRDGRQLSVRSYAIIGPTVWILNERTARKIPLTDLDVPATEQVNARNGIEFRVPGTQSH